MTFALLILLQTWWLSAQAQAVNPSKLAVLSSNDFQVIKAVEMPQPFRLSPYGFGELVPPTPTNAPAIDLSLSHVGNWIWLEWTYGQPDSEQCFQINTNPSPGPSFYCWAHSNKQHKVKVKVPTVNTTYTVRSVNTVSHEPKSEWSNTVEFIVTQPQSAVK